MTPSRNAGRVFAGWVAVVPLLFLVDPLRQAVESRMPLHMLLQFPMLIASGWATAGTRAAERSGLPACLDALNAHGLLGFVVASCVMTVWMIPTALDLALLSEPVRWSKYLSLWVMGALLERSHKVTSLELGIFFTGMLAWMLATVGVIYQTMSRRICVNYLLDEQRWTGVGLVAVASALGVIVVWQIAAAASKSPPALSLDR